MVTMVRRLRSHVALVLGTVLVTATVVGGVSYAFASSDGTGTTFYGCASTATGAIRAATIRAGQPPACKTTETLESWNAAGPQGPQGPQGQVGPVGPASVVNVTGGADCPKPPQPPSNPANMPPSRAFLAIPSIPGDTTDARHARQIDVVSWSWGAAAGANALAGCGGRAGTPSLLDLTVVKRIDKASPLLAQAGMEGTNLDTITLRLGNGSFDYLTLALDTAIVSSYQFNGGANQTVPTETVTFTSSRVTYTLVQQQADGTPGTPISFCYDAQIPVTC